MRALLSLASLSAAAGIDNGLGRAPPMGWRSWNFYGGDISQETMEGVMRRMVSKVRSVDGVPTSLCDLGYCDVGLDDNWQTCQQGAYWSYRDDVGIPLINRDRFPNMLAMTDLAHSLGLTAGWYGNNCICKESRPATDATYQSDVAALTLFGFDGIKLDGCGTQLDLDKWSTLINGTGRPVMIENCHWGNTVPTKSWCPWNFFRSSGDIAADYGSVVHNLQTTVQWARSGLSRPGCWAYPDMLEVGVQPLSLVEWRSHFGAWAIVSSPLVLSNDVHDDTTMDLVWPIISNKEVIAVNQAWAGHSGSPFKESDVLVELPSAPQTSGVMHEGPVPSWQYFYKPMPGPGPRRVAVLLMNHGASPADLGLKFSDVPGLNCGKVAVRCLFDHKDLGLFEDSFEAKSVASHDSRLLMLSCAANDTDVIFA